MFPIDPRNFLKFPDVDAFIIDQKQELTAANVPTVADGQFIVFTYTVPKNQMLVVKTWAPYAQIRENPALPTETFRMINLDYAQGAFLITPEVSGSAPFQMPVDVAAPQTQAGASAVVRDRGNGVVWLSGNPYVDCIRGMYNPMTSFVVGPDKTLRFIFSILPQAGANPLPAAGQFAVGGGETGDNRRVDRAGVMVAAVQMSLQAYNNMMSAVKNVEGA